MTVDGKRRSRHRTAIAWWSLRRRSWAAVPMLMVVGLLTAVQPAMAGPTGSTIAPAQPENASTEAWDPRPTLPGPVVVPRKGTRPAPFTSRTGQLSPKALPGEEKGTGNGLRAGTGAAVRSRTAGAGQDADWYCQEQVARRTSLNADADNYSATVEYLAELSCNFYLDYAYGVAGVVDRTPGYDGTLLYVGSPFAFNRYYYGATSGGVRIPGDFYDGGRQVEILFELYLLAPVGSAWGACGPLPGLRYLLCEGLGTDLLHIVLGTGTLDTGLAAPVIRYTALGDSYSAGTGAPPYLGPPNPTICRRATATYSMQIQGDRFRGLPIDRTNLKACHGARINDLTNRQSLEEFAQVDYVKPYTRLVTVTIGGNDLGFAAKLRDCALSDCGSAPLVTPAELQATQARLVSLYQNILSRMRSDAVLAVLSYPAFLPVPGVDPLPTSSGCFGTNATIDTAELTRIAEATAQARDMIAAAVRATGDGRVVFVDAFDAFQGHRVCSGDPWSNGFVVSDPEDSFHPNARGYRALADRLRQTLGITL
ncbi:SGNH/GDSL hydrolase family protein [Micromonospora sp. C51]|uniref:SGNH/GDSL hydrolase family protein n=1 Tax=Micromonospora sp. C51 TaxID=2824879 RepID=UPI001B385D28|nr:SGNH/GDSL hydrolase family protein [Micromonospora sp. C51]MBQ1047257.1 SGNH/GDSL hydrolase family protein [Micromonospora sp. C51]